MADITDPDAEEYARQHSSPEPPLLVDVMRGTREFSGSYRMLTGHLEGRFLKMLVAISGARRILEIGTYTGYSAISMAEALPADGELITCEIDEAHAQLARSHIARSPDAAKIEVRVGPAIETIAALDGAFDMVFIDADKTSYLDYYEAVLPRDNNKFVIVRSEDLMGSIQRVAQFADERSGAIKIRLEQNELKLSSSSTDTGESEDTIETPYNYDPLVVGFNSQYLIDFLKAIGTAGEVRLEFKDAQSAGQMRPEDGSEDVKYRYILMPMRI